MICFFFQREWYHTLPRNLCRTSPCPPSNMPTRLSALRSTLDLTMLMVRKCNHTFASQLNVIVYQFRRFSCCIFQFGNVFSFLSYVVYYVCHISSCIISMRLLSLPSPPHQRGGKVSYCTLVSLRAWEQQELQTDVGSTAFGSILLSYYAYSAEMILGLWKRLVHVFILAFIKLHRLHNSFVTNLLLHPSQHYQLPHCLQSSTAA